MTLRTPLRAALLVTTLGCACSASFPSTSTVPRLSPGSSPACLPRDEAVALNLFLVERRPDYVRAVARARAFLDGLEVDPIALRERNLKGKKKLVEALDAYYRFFQIEEGQGRAAVLTRVANLGAVTRTGAYHNMATIPDREFKEDATSYLRAALLLDRMGLLDAEYRAGIVAAKGRFDAHMKDRGAHQRRAFHTYYQHFGLAEPFALDSALRAGLIQRHPDPSTLTKDDAYALTHEIFAAFDFGDALEESDFSESDREYLAGALPNLIAVWQARRNPDLVAELVACERYLGNVTHPAYRAGIAYLLGSQNADGTFGSYDAMRAKLGSYVLQGFYLHTVMVVLDALTLGFEDTFRRREPSPCAK